MPRYLVRSSLTQAGLKGTLAEGGTARREVIRKAAESQGGKLEAYYYAFGDDDLVAIVEMPDNVTAAAASMTVGAAGIAKSSTTVLITPEEMDEVAKKAGQTAYTPPGS